MSMVCARCGVRVYLWNGSKRGDYWKHAVGRAGQTCGQPPAQVIEEAAWKRQRVIRTARGGEK